MARIFAYVIDYIIIMLFVCAFRICFIDDIYSQIPLVVISTFSVMYLYFLLNDLLFRGSSIGKIIAGIKIQLKEQNRIKFIFLHPILKLLITIFSPLTLVLYCYKGFRMPYDVLFYESIS